VAIADHDPKMTRALTTHLRAHGWKVLSADNGRDLLRLTERARPDAVIVDADLADIDLDDVIAALRGWTTLPILVLSDSDLEPAKVDALEAGADDYLSKPFGMAELVARLRARVRTSRRTADEHRVVTTEDFIIDLGDRYVMNAAGAVHLTPKEWRIVEMLVRNPHRLVTQSKLLHDVWGPEYVCEANYVRVFIHEIRRKLEPDPTHPRYFITEPGIGLRFEPGLTDAIVARPFALTPGADHAAPHQLSTPVVTEEDTSETR
jgi:two-component system KDP operon response regulator KdpE